MYQRIGPWETDNAKQGLIPSLDQAFESFYRKGQSHSLMPGSQAAPAEPSLK